jgi:hypothetical protein
MVEDKLNEILQRLGEARQLRCRDRVLECWRDAASGELKLREGTGGVVVAIDEVFLGKAVRASGAPMTSVVVASLLCHLIDDPQRHSGVRLIRNS